MGSYIYFIPMKKIAIMVLLAIFMPGCAGRYGGLRYALNSAGSNRCQLQDVLDFYADSSWQKRRAARFLVENMPAHYSYADSNRLCYYAMAGNILQSGLTPEQQRDSMLYLSEQVFQGMELQTVSDNTIISSDYLIKNIERAFALKDSCPWTAHIVFDEFLEYILPYKCVELQELDAWKDTLWNRYSGGLASAAYNDVEYGTAMWAAELLRTEVLDSIGRYGLYDRSGYPLLSAELMTRQTFGDIPDYALLAASVMRSHGVPVAIDQTPVGARYEAPTRWFTILDDRCMWQPSEWDLSTNIGWGFFPYERGPKVFRLCYSINPERKQYMSHSIYGYPFDLGVQDVTDRYFLTSDLNVPVDRKVAHNIVENYAYIASAVRTGKDGIQKGSFRQPMKVRPEPVGWKIVDFGPMKHGKAFFSKMGREVMYLVLGYDGHGLIPVTDPFILHKDGQMEYLSLDTMAFTNNDQWCNNNTF